MRTASAKAASTRRFAGRPLSRPVFIYVSMKAADRSGASHAVVVGERDLEAGVAQVKDLSTGEQTAVPLDDLVAHIQELFS